MFSLETRDLGKTGVLRKGEGLSFWVDLGLNPTNVTIERKVNVYTEEETGFKTRGTPFPDERVGRDKG